METLKIWYTDFWPEWKDEDFITPILARNYDIVLDRNKPDILFHSIFNRMSDSPNYNCKKVLFLGENYRPEQFKSNYSISFDPHSGINFRLPLWQVYLLKNPELKTRLFTGRKLQDFQNWNAMVVSNSGNFFRNSLFELLNEYKRVKSYGRYHNNDQELIKASQGKYWRDAKDEFFQSHTHKFMMAVENSPYRYYCTEKLMDAFLANSLPIYWGDPRVSEDWNEKSFINGSKINILETVKKIDNDKALFNAMFLEPVFTDLQKQNLEENLDNFEKWLNHIIL